MNLTFDHRWRQPYESSWCTHEKVKFANECTGSEYMNLLNIKENQPSQSTISTSIKSINKLESLLGISFNDIYLQDISRLLGPLYYSRDIDRYFANYLRFCPLCLEKGYHSIYHQLLFNQYCPFHNTLLETILPSIPIDITKRKIDLGFHFLFSRYNINYSVVDIFNGWYASKEFSLPNLKIIPVGVERCLLYYVPLSLNDHDKHLELFTSKSKQFNKIMQLTEQDFIMRGTVVERSCFLRNVNTNITDEIISEKLTNLYLLIYKAIAKHIRRRNINIIIALRALQNKTSPQRCNVEIQLIKDRILNPIACAYILWSRDICGYRLYHHVGYTELTSTILQSSVYYQYMLNEFRRYKMLYSDMPIDIFANIMQYYLIKIFWVQFNQYFKWSYSELVLKNKKQINLGYKSIGDMPLLVVWKQDATGKYYMLKM